MHDSSGGSIALITADCTCMLQQPCSRACALGSRCCLELSALLLGRQASASSVSQAHIIQQDSLAGAGAPLTMPLCC